MTLIACCAFIGTQAIPAYPRRVKIVTATDTFYLTLRGDENCKYALTDDGYTALPDSGGWLYACTNPDGEVVKSAYRVCSEGRKDADVRNFLTRQSKGLFPSVPQDATAKRMCPGRSQASRPARAVVGSRRALIILMQYSDVKFQKTQTDFDRLFNEQGYREDGAYGSVYDYYDKVSYGQLQLQCDVLGPYTASRGMSYYGGNSGRSGNDSNPKALFDEAIRFAQQEVDLSDYDSDGDGYVDNVHIIFAGYGEEAGASANAIWSHEMTFATESVGGMLIDHYSCSPELRGNVGTGISRIGPPCHELGHALGAMDYYDVDYQTGGYYEGTGEWDIMASGSWNDDGARPADFNPYVKAYDFGWVEVQALEPDTVNTIGPSTRRNNIYRIDTPVSGDFFLLDNRQSEGITSAEPGKGLLVFHIGPQIAQKARTNTINATYPQQCYVVCASAKEARPRASASSYGDISSAGCPYPGTTRNTSFTRASVPAAYCISGRDADLSLTGIAEDGRGNIQLRYGKAASGEEPPTEEPATDDDPVEGEIIWSDDFEITPLFHTREWTSESLIGQGAWQIKTYSSTPSDKEPTAISGSRYMSMEVAKSGVIMGGDSKFCCQTVSDDIRLTPGEYVLTGKYGGYSTKKVSTDTLVVEIQHDGNSLQAAGLSLRITTPQEWNDFAVPIRCEEEGFVRIAFTGIADETSRLFLDNLILYKAGTDRMVPVRPEAEAPACVYRLDGTFLGRLSEKAPTLRRGVYLIRQGRTTHKVYLHK